MQIIIPMSGSGRRFLARGYTIPKPLIPVDGRPIIEYVVKLFPADSRFTFICNQNHLKNTDMRRRLETIVPNCTIVAIPEHKKGPVYATSQAFDCIKDNEEAVVNYCDFSKYWDFTDFLEHTRRRNADGAITAYRGFHPHMLSSSNYAFIKDEEQWLSAIKEKESFTADRMQEHASDGTHYFKSGALLKKYFLRLMERDINVNGEYYVSLVYNLMKEDGLKISVYEIQHMLQWGNPEDLREYQRWSWYFRNVLESKKNYTPQQSGINVIPLAGEGKRFSGSGYAAPKPLIEVSGRPMVIQAARCLPEAGEHVFVCRREHLDKYGLKSEIQKEFPRARIIGLPGKTEGQACSCARGLEGVDPGQPLFIGACDNGMAWDADKYNALLNDPEVDAVVWGFRHHPIAALHPEQYGWCKLDGHDNVVATSIKKPISSDPYNDFGMTGAFYFRKSGYFSAALEALQKNDLRVNNEFYVDSCVEVMISMGLKVKGFKTDFYACWGTPDDLATFEYWQSFFHKCAWHPYCLENDPAMEAGRVEEYDAKFRNFRQTYS